MQTKMERIDVKVAEARKQLDKANAKRDEAISALTRAADRIKAEQRSLARLERQKQEIRNEDRRQRMAKRTPASAEPIPAL